MNTSNHINNTLIFQTPSSSLDWAHPLVREWFVNKFETPTEPQILGWPMILANKPTLISAPTGSGKTFAAFMVCVERLIRQSLAGQLSQDTHILYVSPLKALSNDIQKNLTEPLSEIRALAMARQLTWQEITVALRTGDTTPGERQAMLKKPPHILVTTPESLYILLTAEKSREMLKQIRTVIIDEIHALVSDKRGSHLSLSLERLAALTEKPFQRIGLSATQKPLTLVGDFLTGGGCPQIDAGGGCPPIDKDGCPEMKTSIINIGHSKSFDLAIEVPGSELGPITSHELWDEIYDRLANLSQQHRSTLIFVNTRRLAERIAHQLTERLGPEQVAAHHGSLSRKSRLNVETRLKNGQLKALVATASLELGIDIGTIDLVCQIGSPRAIATALQRIGRAGHWRGAISKGRIFATTRDELLECAAMVYAIRQGELDQLIMPSRPLDILAQQIVATCATAEWHEDDLFKLVKRAYPYTSLSREEFNQVLDILAEGVATARGRYGAYLFRDRVNHIVRARRGSRLTAIMNGGAIAETSLFTVIAQPEGIMVGTLDEDFAVESSRGDIILLGTTSWRVQRVESAAGRVLVESAHGAPPNVPFWRGEAPARTLELSTCVAQLRDYISHQLPVSTPISNFQTQPEVVQLVQWLIANCGLNQAGAQQLIEYIIQGRAALGAVPTQKTIIAERFFDESGGMQLLIHAPLGARINKAWGLALRKCFCRSFNFELQASATDNGLNISLAEQHSFPLMDVFHFLHPKTVRKVVTQAVLQSPLFATKWRAAATRSLALPRFRNGKKIPPHIIRMRADDLLAAVFPDAAACQDNLAGKEIELPDHPLVNEAMKDALTEAMDIDGLIQILKDIESGEITCLAVDTTTPSVFSHEILNANPYAYLDDAPLEERRARAVVLRRMLPETVLNEIGHLDEAAIEMVIRQAWPDVRSPDELHDLLQTFIAVPENMSLSVSRTLLPKWRAYLSALITAGRAGIARYRGQYFWLAAEKMNSFMALFIGAELQTPLISVEENTPDHEQALVNTLRGWLFHLGPTTACELSHLLCLNLAEVEIALLQLEVAGTILRGQFRNNNKHHTDCLSPHEFDNNKLDSKVKNNALDSGFKQGEAVHLGRTDPFVSPIEWCERRLLARIHQQTLTGLRKSIQPVSPALFMRWLLNWQHIAPGTQLTGEMGLLEIIKQLQGFEMPANAWEKDILAKRLADYQPSLLDRLCLTGSIGWGRFSPHPAFLALPTKTGTTTAASAAAMTMTSSQRRISPTSIAPITFFVRADMNWLSLKALKSQSSSAQSLTSQSSTSQQCSLAKRANDLDALSSVGKNIYRYLQLRGACFFADIVRGVGHLPTEVENGLWELITAGLATADGFDNLRALINPKRRQGQGRYQIAKPRHSTGRWSLLFPEFESTLTHDLSVADSSDPVTPVNNTHDLETICWVLLKRWGVVFRDLLARETLLPPWRDLLIAFRRLEDRGEIRGGRFVDGFLGEQFALPYAVDSLRAIKQQKLPELNAQMMTIAAVDPLNLIGIILPGERVPAISTKVVTIPQFVGDEAT